MNRKVVLTILSAFFTSLMIFSGYSAATNQSISIPIKISLVPTPNFQFISITFTYDPATHRYTSANITVQNISLSTRNCTVQLNFYQNGTSIAYASQQILNILESQTKSAIVTLTWVTAKNLSQVTSGDLIIY